ncbi:MAG TPA: aminotransferase class V-fold PLP-dependent enzyme [Steroidobacteraceae bacterium]|nr:aminotransferase class V-fold PLP-dependent enzyme [Steroidobacteraceae bacterium]
MPVGGFSCAFLAEAVTADAMGVLGLGRDALVKVPCDAQGRIRIDALVQGLDQADGLPVAIVGNLGSTNSGAIDPVGELVEIARSRNLWLHLDGAYGLPGVLDPAVAALYDGMAEADSIIVDPHKWLGAPVGIGATFVRDIELLQRAFTQGPAAYLEGSLAAQTFVHSMDSLGTPYSDWGVELSAPSRGAVVWASPLPPAPDARVVTGLHPADRGRSRDRRAHRPADRHQRQRRDALRAGAGAEGRHLRRHVIRRDLRRCAAGGTGGSAGLDHPLHAARYRRALPDDAAVRRRAGRHD